MLFMKPKHIIFCRIRCRHFHDHLILLLKSFNHIFGSVQGRLLFSLNGFVSFFMKENPLEKA